MTCPKCAAEFRALRRTCPRCGIQLLHNVSGVVKTSIVMISAHGENSFYHSVKDVPEPLRTQLADSTAGVNSGTIVIADRAGKEQLTQTLARQDSKRWVNAGLSDSGLSVAGLLSPVPASRLHRYSWVAWAGFVIVLALAGIISALFGMRW
jgi:predicted amidophosphoribosyltransferase